MKKLKIFKSKDVCDVQFGDNAVRVKLYDGSEFLYSTSQVTFVEDESYEEKKTHALTLYA